MMAFSTDGFFGDNRGGPSHAELKLRKIEHLLTNDGTDNRGCYDNLLYDEFEDMDIAYEAEVMNLAKLDVLTNKQQSEDIRIVRLLDTIIQEGASVKATDVQVSFPTLTHAIARFRVDGKMRNIRRISKTAAHPLACCVKRLGKLNLEEKQRPQDGSFSHIVNGKVYDIRVSIIPTNRGENIDLRILYKTELKTNLESLGLRTKVIDALREVSSKKDGMILLTGPTGSGKTTTLYTLIGELIERYNNEKNIITIENPIEYSIDYIVQSQIDLLRGYDFDVALRAMLRQNPDILLIGEIRDLVTGRTAARASTTGHLVLSTIHSTSVSDVLVSLKQIGIEPYEISSSLQLVLNQRLVGRLCPHCKKPRLIKREERTYFPESEIEDIWLASGCEKCDYKGTSGLVLLVEMLRSDNEYKKLIYENVTGEMVHSRMLGNPNYYTLREDVLYHLRLGDISIQDAIAVISKGS